MLGLSKPRMICFVLFLWLLGVLTPFVHQIKNKKLSHTYHIISKHINTKGKGKVKAIGKTL
ncbi:hypothetical protein ACE6H2_022796 [Prunus campanulata]